MTFQEFISKYNDKSADFDNVFGAQCVDLYRQYCKEVLNVPQSPPTGSRGAVAIWDTYLTDYFDRIVNTPTGVPQNGDIVIWGTGAGPYGHVAIFIEGTDKSFKSFDQNWPVGSLCHIQGHYYSNVLGWLHPRGIISASQNMDQAAIDYFVSKGIKTEGEARGLIGQVTDFLSLQENFKNLQIKYDERTKEDRAELDRLNSLAENRKQQYDNFVLNIATILGTTKEEAKIVSEIKSLVTIEDQLRSCQNSLKAAQSGLPIQGPNWIDSLAHWINKLLIKWQKK